MAFGQKTEKVYEVSGFADRQMDMLRGLFNSKIASSEGVTETQSANPVRLEDPVQQRLVQAAPGEVTDQVTLDQHEEDDGGMNWLSNLSSNYH